MTDFSFYNRAYDLLLQLKEEGRITDEPPKKTPSITNVGELRLAIDLVKDMYPLYKDADNKTIVDFINEIFNSKVKESEIDKVDLPEEEYRVPHIDEIKPGALFRLVGISVHFDGSKSEYYYNYRFPSNLSDDPKQYSDCFFKIWNLVKEGKGWIKNTYKHRIDDIVQYITDPASKGYVRDRRINGDINEYCVFWANVSNNTSVPFRYWEPEDHLINQTRSEAKPMKTAKIKTRFIKCIATVTYKKFSPKEWIEENVRNGYDRAVYEKLIEGQENSDFKPHGWVDEEKRIPINTHAFIAEAVQEILCPEGNWNGVDINTIKVLKLEPWPKEINSKRVIKPKKSQGKPRTKKSRSEKKPVTNRPDTTDHLVCVKHMPSGYVSRMPKSQAKRLIDRTDSSYDYCTKLEWRQCVKTIEKAKADKTEKTIYKIGKDPVTGIELNRKGRRFDKQKYRKGSRLVKEQFVVKIVPEEEITKFSYVPIFRYIKTGVDIFKKVLFDREERKEKFTAPARTILKRILTRVQPHKEVKVTPSVLEERKERSLLDKDKYNKNKKYKSLPELTKIFKNDERRNDHYSESEKWSKSFDRLQHLILSGTLLTEIDGKVVSNQLKRKDVAVWIKQIITEEHNFKWSDEKIADFVRYIRLTSHGLFDFTKVPKRTNKKHILPKIFEAVKHITRLDKSKLRYNVPDQDKPLVIKYPDDGGDVELGGILFRDGDFVTKDGDHVCALRDIIAWKYEEDENFQELITDTGGGILEIPIKFRWVKNKLNELPFISTDNEKATENKA
jgi:hypothetical protein